MGWIGDVTIRRDPVEDAIYSSPPGSATPWRCVACDVPIAKSGDPCRCTHPNKFPRSEHVVSGSSPRQGDR